MRLDDLIRKYILLRDKKAEFKKEYDDKVAAIDEMLKKMEGVLLKTFQETGQDSAKCEGVGTAYKSLQTSATVADRDSFFSWINEDFEERQAFLENRVSKAAVEQFKSANEDLPPGVNWREYITINVRRS